MVFVDQRTKRFEKKDAKTKLIKFCKHHDWKNGGCKEWR